MASDVWQPLEGVRVVDFSMLLPGPLTTVVLGDLGADVIKVEPPGGDYARQMKNNTLKGTNRNKRSIALDLKVASARQVVDRLAAWADVVVEGFRPGVADKLGFGPARLRGINPGLVYCSISGFGQTGPARTHSGHDLAYMAMGGGMAHKGQLRSPPQRAALPVADYLGGAYAGIAILAALRERDRTGKGIAIDLSLYESVLFATLMRFGADTPPTSLTHLFPANDVFACADGRDLALTVVEQTFWDQFVAAVGGAFPEIASPDFADEEGRLQHHRRLMGLLDAMFATRPAAEWVALFERYDVPAAICVTPAEALASAHARARALHHETAEGPVMPFPAVTDRGRVPSPRRAAPSLSMDAHAILDQIGFKRDEAEALLAGGAVVAPAI